MTSHIAEIRQRATNLLESLPRGVTLVAAAKGRTVEEVRAVIEAGLTTIGHNYVQEARPMVATLGDSATWHMIGHLQRNKARHAVKLFDLIETLDSLRLARELDKRCAQAARTLPVLVEVNSGREASKTGVIPEALQDLVAELLTLEHLRVQGLMTMGPAFGDPELARPFFKETRKAFERLAVIDHPRLEMRYLSMGMSNSYQVALEEGANIVRIGTRLFGPRPQGA